MGSQSLTLETSTTQMELGELKEKAMKCELLPESDIKNICDKVRELFAKEDNVVSVSTPVTIAGDIHGQFHDLLQLFITGGDSQTPSICSWVTMLTVADTLSRSSRSCSS